MSALWETWPRCQVLYNRRIRAGWRCPDDSRNVNVSKARVNLPADLREQLKPRIEKLTKHAGKVYRSGPKSGGTPAGPGVGTTPAPTASSSATGGTAGTDPAAQAAGSSAPSNGASPVATTGTGATRPAPSPHLGRALEAAARKARKAKALRKIRATLKKEEPDAAREIGW